MITTAWCIRSCEGDTCIRYHSQSNYCTGGMSAPYAFTEPGWGWQVCTLHGSCQCTERTDWKVIWGRDQESLTSLITLSHFTENGPSTKKDEL